MSIIIEEINSTIRPLELVINYILFKNNGEMEEKKLEKEMNSFIKAITPKILEGMIDKCVELGYIKQDENGNITL